jgi:malonyl-CoA O-methyltransferase
LFLGLFGLTWVRKGVYTSYTLNHVNQFIDMHDIGDALLFDGFAEPVMEAEMLTVTYNSVDEIMHDL